MTEFVVDVENGRINDFNRLRIAQAIKPFDGKKVRITIKEYKPKASGSMRGYWFDVVVKHVADHCGYTADEAHDELLWHLMPEHRTTVKRLDGTETQKRVSWTDLDTNDACLLFERAWRFAAQDLGVHIPSPGEYGVAA